MPAFWACTGAGRGATRPYTVKMTVDGPARGAPEVAAVTGPPPAEAARRVLTIPNGVTAVRLACIPLFAWVLFGAHQAAAASVLLAALGATDWVDGQLARRLGQVSTVGKVLDPTADRALVATAVMSTVVVGAVPVWFGLATLVREALVSAAVLLLASLGAERIDVLWIGKAGTFALMSAYPAFLMAHGAAGWQVDLRDAAWVVGVAGLAAAWAAAACYVPVARRALARGRAGHHAE